MFVAPLLVLVIDVEPLAAAAGLAADIAAAAVAAPNAPASISLRETPFAVALT
ncbi:hypothetical protein PYH37_005046 [Sinorhizobium numidicum]|uniref:Uncharacterized protein n=1 Tax=Sinorhizobium numidicum TaxID=680248 RepID=A0ABY8D1G0_9HYPH|nr:hypothetical protein [Sinorhizobium numidicum]WEX76719.1 hypothetical protein PYH37_005046 [Sinorhizobium numidicum]WEX83380.1 hypothetical protein PYH38_005758 [Sinorhizobium numidicum]